MGPRRSGKTSIQKVVFSKMSPHETLFIEPTTEVRKADYPPLPPALLPSALIQFQLLDFPGNYEFFDKKSKVTADRIFSRAGALVFVIDSQDEESFADAVEYLLYTASTAYQVRRNKTLPSAPNTCSFVRSLLFVYVVCYFTSYFFSFLLKTVHFDATYTLHYVAHSHLSLCFVSVCYLSVGEPRAVADGAAAQGRLGLVHH